MLVIKTISFKSSKYLNPKIGYRVKDMYSLSSTSLLYEVFDSMYI